MLTFALPMNRESLSCANMEQEMTINNNSTWIRFILKSGNKTIEIANIDIKKQYTIFYGEFRYCLILHFDKKTTSFFLPNDCFKWFLAGNNDKITCIHDGKAAFILFSECL